MNTSKIALYTNPDEVLTLTPEESIISMFEHTDKNGILFIPEWPYDSNYNNKQRFCQCAMNWHKTDAENVVSEFKSLYAALEKMSEKYNSENMDYDIKNISEDLFNVWNSYLRDFETGDIDVKLAIDISDRMETINMVKSIAEKIENGTDISKEESSFYNNYRSTNISEKEKAIYNAYRDAIHTDANGPFLGSLPENSFQCPRR